MTKKHFIKLTEIISHNIRYDGYTDYSIKYDTFLTELIKLCKDSNSLFNENQFKKAINLKMLKSNKNEYNSK